MSAKRQGEVSAILTELANASDLNEDQLHELEERVDNSPYVGCVEDTNTALQLSRELRDLMSRALSNGDIVSLVHGIKHLQEDMPLPNSVLSRWCISFIKDVAVDFKRRVIVSRLKGKKEVEF